MKTPGFVPRLWGSVVGAGPSGGSPTGGGGGSPTLQPELVPDWKTNLITPKAFLLGPVAGRRELRQLPLTGLPAPPGISWPLPVSCPDIPLLPKTLSSASNTGSGTGRALTPPAPHNRMGFYASQNRPAWASLWGPAEHPWPAGEEPRGITVKSQHPDLSDPTRRCRHLAEPAPLVCAWGHGAETLQHVLAPVLCPALVFLFGEQRPGGPCRTEKG